MLLQLNLICFLITGKSLKEVTIVENKIDYYWLYQQLRKWATRNVCSYSKFKKCRTTVYTCTAIVFVCATIHISSSIISYFRKSADSSAICESRKIVDSLIIKATGTTYWLTANISSIFPLHSAAAFIYTRPEWTDL